MLKQSLQQKLLQRLTPQQIQMIKLLELPTLQLEQRIKKELEENPALDDGEETDIVDKTAAEETDNDVGNDVEPDVDDNRQTEDDDTDDTDVDADGDNYDDEFSLEDYLPDDDELPNYRLNANNYAGDDDRKEIPFSGTKTFQESLSEQLILKDVTEREKMLAVFIIGNIDDDGYLRRDLDAIVDDIAFSQNVMVTEKELRRVLSVVQDLDPPGVAARSLQECLLLQLQHFDMQDKNVDMAVNILTNCFPEFTRKHYTKIMNRCNIDETELKAAIDVILKLNPKPGSSFGEVAGRNFEAVTPDFNVDVDGDKIDVTLTSGNMPVLKISNRFSRLMQQYLDNKNPRASDKKALNFMRQKLDSARWFIDAVNQRCETLLYTMNAIVEFQRRFFLTGDETTIKPMVLRDISDLTGFDVSTISRVTNSKFAATPYGNYPLKYFFSDAVQTVSGEEVSTVGVKQTLKNFVDAEDKANPLTDDQLSELLSGKGFNIARRTVAKYREQLDIPVARLRRQL